MSEDGLISASGERDPLDALAKAMERVARGRLDTKLGAWPDEPYRSLFATFNRMTESLLSTEGLNESFASNVAHEFKTPLAYIQGYATLLQDDSLTDEQRSRYVTNIYNGSARLSDIVNGLLQISSISRPDAAFSTETFSLDEQLRHAMAIFIPNIERKGVAYELDLDEIDIDGNAILLEDVWTNLLSNAVKHTPEGGMISVSLRRCKDTATASIADTGYGMPREQIEHAFDRFYQGEKSQSGVSGGLGLPIVQAIVKKHGGEVRIDSEPGRGSTFTVTLPLSQRA